MESFRLILINNADPENVKEYVEDYSEKYNRRFIVGMDDELVFESPYVDPEHHAFIKALMDFTPEDHSYWDLLSNNEGIKGDTKMLKFDLEAKFKNFLKMYEGKGSYQSLAPNDRNVSRASWVYLRFLWEAGMIFHELQCSGMSAIIGQYLAAIFGDMRMKNKDTAPRDYGDMIAMPIDERMYKKLGLDYDDNDPEKNRAAREAYMNSKPTFDDVIIAVAKNVPNPQIINFYPNILNKDPNDFTVHGPEIVIKGEEMTAAVQKSMQSFDERQE